MAIREGRWDCPSCGSTGIFGRHVECLSCGKPRPGGVRFYLSDDAPVLVDPERIAEARAGADWVCEHCAATNRATHPDCEGCGAPRG
ncbi:MAG TPA: zinc finger protein, partial [Longimicrobium sp.]